MKNCSNQPTYFLVLSLKQQSHSSVYVKRAPDVLKKNAKFHIRQTHVRGTSKARYEHVGYAWCTSGARRCTSLKIVARFVRVWDKKINMLKSFLEARRVPGV